MHIWLLKIWPKLEKKSPKIKCVPQILFWHFKMLYLDTLLIHDVSQNDKIKFYFKCHLMLVPGLSYCHSHCIFLLLSATKIQVKGHRMVHHQRLFLVDLFVELKRTKKYRNYCISKQLFYWWLDNPTVQSFTEFCLIQSRILAILQISKMHFRECTINFLLLMRSLRFNLISFIKFLPSRFLIHRARKWKSSWLNKEPFNKFQIQKFENE